MELRLLCNPQIAKGHAKSIATSVNGVANSESSPGFAAARGPVVLLDQKSNIRYTEEGMKLVVSFHRRGNIVPEFESDPEESQNDQEPSETGSSDLSYKEEFELELGSYEIQYSSESTSTSSNDTGEEDGSTRKRAEMLDNYEIAEIGHGRRKFIPKARPGTLDSTFFGTPIEQKAPPLGSHPLKVSTTGIRKERRRSALKAHHDFLYAAKNSSAAFPESEEDDLIAKAVENILTKHAGLSVDSHSEKPTLEGSNTCERVQNRGEWIQNTG